MSDQDQPRVPVDWNAIANKESAPPALDLHSQRRREARQELLLVAGFIVGFFLFVVVIIFICKGFPSSGESPPTTQTEDDGRPWETPAERAARRKWQDAHKRGDEKGMQDASKEMDELAKKRQQLMTPEQLKYYEKKLP